MSEDHDHYFTADPTSAFRRAPATYAAWGHELTVQTGSGVFAQGRLDIGTAALLHGTDPPPPGRVLDLGCGWGAIGLAVATAVPDAVVTGVDVNERALLLARENAAALGLGERFRAVVPDAVDADERFDEIWSNPPIRVGKQALHELLLTWLPRLEPGGRAVLVVGKQLGADSLQRWLGEQGWPTARLGTHKRFRLLESRRG